MPGSELFQSWEVADSVAFYKASKPNSVSLDKYRETVLGVVPDLSALSLLRRALPLLPAHSADRFNVKVAIENPTLIFPIQCWEALLLSQQTDRMDMVKSPTEFMAFVLRSRRHRGLKIFYYTINQAGMKGLAKITAWVKQEINTNPDWQVSQNLHNHNFLLGQDNILGVTAPSAADVGAFREMAIDLNLQEARITNGFDTIRLGAADFSKFATAYR